MATLTEAEKVKLRNAAERKAVELGMPVRWGKALLHDAVQSVEDLLDSTAFKTAISDDIDAAVLPYHNAVFSGFTNSEKRWLAALVFRVKFDRDIVG